MNLTTACTILPWGKDEKKEWAAYDSDIKYHIVQCTSGRSLDGFCKDDDIKTFLQQNESVLIIHV